MRLIGRQIRYSFVMLLDFFYKGKFHVKTVFMVSEYRNSANFNLIGTLVQLGVYKITVVIITNYNNHGKTFYYISPVPTCTCRHVVSLLSPLASASACTLSISGEYIRNNLSDYLQILNTRPLRGLDMPFGELVDLLMVQYYDLIRCFDTHFWCISEELFDHSIIY